MPHASLLGSNGHCSTFTSKMISGQINVFIVLWKYKNTPTYTAQDISYTCMSKFLCAHGTELKAQYNNTCGLFAHTTLSVTEVLLSGIRRTLIISEGKTDPHVRLTQLKDQHHLEVKVRYCPLLNHKRKLLRVCSLENKCFPQIDLLYTKWLFPFILEEGICCHNVHILLDFEKKPFSYRQGQIHSSWREKPQKEISAA